MTGAKLATETILQSSKEDCEVSRRRVRVEAFSKEEVDLIQKLMSVLVVPKYSEKLYRLRARFSQHY